MWKQLNGGSIMMMLKFVLGNFNGKYRRKHKSNRAGLNDNKQNGAYVALNHNDVLAVYCLQKSLYQVLGEKYNYIFHNWFK